MSPFDPNRFATVHQRIHAACQRAGRNPADVSLIGATKTRSMETCREAHAAGLLDLAENYVQEWDAKAQGALGWDPPIRWHFIGRLQSNKIAALVGRVHLIHTVDREKLLHAIDRHASARGMTAEILLQVNVAQEPQKGGCAPADLLALARVAATLEAVQLRGLMTIAPLAADAEETRPIFQALRDHLNTLRDDLGDPGIHELSMGMTADLEVAVEEGATLVRVGTALFGPRD